MVLLNYLRRCHYHCSCRSKVTGHICATLFTAWTTGVHFLITFVITFVPQPTEFVCLSFFSTTDDDYQLPLFSFVSFQKTFYST